MRCTLATLLLALSAGPALACTTAGTGAKCVTVDEGLRGGGAGHWQRAPIITTPPPLAVGVRLDGRDFNALVGTAYLGLPPARDGWVYVRLDDRIYRVDFRTREVLALVRD
ncbi:hypothetical protein [Palleronia pelagia]|uniref:Nickel/cobalt transporter regulator n=1 Tax=Palleronia pelagia TaxID=387096 RepID=A0A1H8ICM2_9RHOB|nr:hypothetical protein [Palleronia pelagia]SEN66204.1 hypothetical protein SAMN04488011_105185 [Palleronia pelagia]